MTRDLRPPHTSGSTTRTLLTLAAFASLSPALAAQQSLAGLEARFRNEARELLTSESGYEAREKLLARHIDELRTFVSEQARGDDRWNGRLMLADLELARGDRDAASKALAEIDADAAPPLVLVTGAAMAQHLQQAELRDRWIEAATGKPAATEDLLAMGRLLMTVLGEVERGEAQFGRALAQATDDEQRAYIRYHRADALRDREDLPENAAYEALDQLAKALPNTYMGSVAKDRLRATQMRIGDDAITLMGATLDGKRFSLAEQRGKGVVIAFWTAADFDTPLVVEAIEKQLAAHPDLVAIAVSLDRDPAAIRAATERFGIDFPVIGDGKGTQCDAALRWFAEGPVLHVVDKRGKLAGIGLNVGTNDGRAAFASAIGKALE